MVDNNEVSQNPIDRKSENSPTTGAAPSQDRSGRVKGMGVFEIVLGSLCGLVTLILIPLSLFQRSMMSSLGQAPSNSATSLFFSIGVYAVLSVSLIWVGASALKLRRWVPKVVLAINWPFLVMGALTTVSTIWFMPALMRMSAASTAAAGGAAALSAKMTESIAAVTTVATVVFLFLILVLIPGLHVLLFRGPDVQKTCDLHDPTPRWTDRLPTTVVALVIWLGVSSFSWLGMGVSGYGAMFGFVLTGLPALALGLVAAAVAGVLVRYLAKQSLLAWWATVAFFAVMFFGGFTTFLMMDLSEFYRRSGLLPEQQIALMKPMMGFLTHAMRVFVGISGAAIFIFLAVVKKHFKA